MQGPLEVLRDGVARLDSARIPYFLVGSLASMYFGRPRFTKDIDLVVQLHPSSVIGFSQVFNIEDYYCPPTEVLADEVVRRGSFNLIHQNSGINVDLIMYSHTDYHQSEISRRQKIKILPDLNVFIASAENIILKKLDYFRDGGSQKHLDDIRDILAASPVDQEYLAIWIERLDLKKYWLMV